jgi:hypothetical protein
MDLKYELYIDEKTNKFFNGYDDINKENIKKLLNDQPKEFRRILKKTLNENHYGLAIIVNFIPVVNFALMAFMCLLIFIDDNKKYSSKYFPGKEYYFRVFEKIFYKFLN